MSHAPMSHDEWVQAALAARVEQGLPEQIEDPATLVVLADILTHPGNAERFDSPDCITQPAR